MEKLNRSLYVEGGPDIQMTAKPALEVMRGFTLEVCNFCNAMLRKAAQLAPQFVVFDVMMSGMDSRTIRKQLSAFPQPVPSPVIFMAAKVELKKAEIDTKLFYPFLDRKKLGALS